MTDLDLLSPPYLNPQSAIVIAPTNAVLTITQGKLRAGLDWPEGDPRDDLMMSWIAAATAKVEKDTGLALLEQTRDVYFDGPLPAIVTLPSQSRPLQSITSITWTDSAEADWVLDPASYVIDPIGGRIALVSGSAWPTNLSPLQPWVIRIIAGWASPEVIPPLLFHAVGLLTAHLATYGRDLASIEEMTEMPYGYDDAIAQYRPIAS